MRVLHLLPHVRDRGNGIVNATVDLACAQRWAGHDVYVASAGGAFDRLLGDHAVGHVAVDSRRGWRGWRQWVGGARRAVAAVDPDVVHAHTPVLAAAAWTGRGGARFRLVATAHREVDRGAALLGLAQRVIAPSEAVATGMEGRWIDAGKIRVVHNGTIGSPRSRPVGPPKALLQPAIVTVAGMYARKGVGVLIEAFDAVAEEFPGAHLYLVGEGRDRRRFTDLAEATEARDRIHFEGFQAEPHAYLAAAPIFVLASLDEAFGLAVVEARAAGCAVVASDVGGIPEALDGGAAGHLFAPGDAPALARHLRTLLGDAAALERSRARAVADLDHFRVERVAHETLAVYADVLAGVAPAPVVEGMAA